MLANSRDELTLYDTVTDIRLPFGVLPWDDAFGTGVCEAANGRIYVMSPMDGLSIIQDEGDRLFMYDVREAGWFAGSDRGAPYLHGEAYAVATYGNTLAVGCFALPYVTVLDLNGRVQGVIGPRFTYRGATYSFALGDENTLCVHGELEGLYVDCWERIWVTPDSCRICVFSAAGECLYMSAEAEFHISDELNARLQVDRWGVDSRGWLWCGGGSTAYTIPELGPESFSPTLPGLRPERSGLKPELG